MRRAIVFGVILAASLSGCTDNATPSSPNPGTTSSTPGGTSPTSAGNVSAAARTNPYGVGRVWTYTSNIGRGDTTNVIEISDATATHLTLKYTRTFGRSVSNGTTTVAKSGTNGTEFVFAGAIADAKYKYWSPNGSNRTTEKETVTVAAGTFEATKVMYRKQEGGNSIVSDTWISDELGILKQVCTESGGGFTATTSVELVSVQ